MDSDLWISQLAAAKRHLSLQRHQNSQLERQFGAADRLSIDDFEAVEEEEEGARPDFPCPYCYEDHDIASLCSHLEEEHSFESKAAVCPICSVKIARNMLNHITLQHGYLFKTRRRSLPNSQALSLLGRDLREAQLRVLLRSGGYQSSNNNASTALTDSLLSSLVLNFPSSEADEQSRSSISSAEDLTNKKTTPLQAWKSSSDLSLSQEEREKKRRQATVRATFVQDLLLATLFGD